MRNHEQELTRFFNSKAFVIIMGFLMTSVIAVILTVAGLLTSQNWSSNRSSFASTFKGDSQQTLSPSRPSFSPILLQLRPSFSKFRKRSSMSRNGREDGLFDSFGGYGGYGGGYGAIEKSDFYYILPILLVIGLGSFLIPIISTFFTALVTSSGSIGGCCGRRKRRGNNPIIGIDTIYDIWLTVEKAIEKLANNFER